MEQTYSAKRVIISLFIVIAIILIFYGVTVLLTKNKKNEVTNNNDSSEAVIQYEEILAGEIYQQKENEYYVLAYTDSSDSQKYISALDEYSKIEKATKTYKIDLASGFNKSYVASESNFEGQYPIYSGPTLLKITDKQITETYTNNDITTQIENMKNLIKE